MYNTPTALDTEPYTKCATAARFLGISAPTLKRKAKDGLIPFYSLDGRPLLFRISEVERALRANRRAR
jgi:excisionase family DNA binding protein